MILATSFLEASFFMEDNGPGRLTGNYEVLNGMKTGRIGMVSSGDLGEPRRNQPSSQTREIAASQTEIRANERRLSALEAKARRLGAAEENIMFDFTKNPLKDLRAFASFQSEALQNASLLLGGKPALQRTQRLLDDISSALQLTHRMSRELVVLHQLLSFHNVHVHERIEAACFADIDPASPIVGDLCLLNEALKDQLYRLQGEHPFKDFDLLFAA
jgi:hypothetical protein